VERLIYVYFNQKMREHEALVESEGGVMSESFGTTDHKQGWADFCVEDAAFKLSRTVWVTYGFIYFNILAVFLVSNENV
jgi:hypothetical protein